METIGSKVLFLILWVCVAVSPCFGYYSGYRSYRSYRSGYQSGYGSGYYDSTSTAKLKGWHYGLIIGVVVVLCVILFLYVYCKKEESNDLEPAPVEPNVDQTQQLPMDPSTAMPCNTNDALDKQNSGPSSAPQAGFTTPYPATTSSNPPQPYPFNNGTVPYPTDGTNPATMGIVQPPPYESKTA